MAKILIVDPDDYSNTQLEAALQGDGYETVSTGDGIAALRLLNDDPSINLVIAAQETPEIGGLELVEAARERRAHLPVIVTAAFGDIDDAVTAMRRGAEFYLTKPFTDDQLLIEVKKAFERAALENENDKLREALDDRLRLENFVSTDARMQGVFKTVKAVAKARTTVLITGESGTGKTLLARAIHAASDRHDGPFVEVNCGALPETLLETELFGHVQGAFTGAVRDKVGKFEAANNGTIFLDEIGTSSLPFQIKLLRVLQDRILERLGDSKTIEVDVRVILATNLDLTKAVREGNFREDLYYRINVVSLEMPALRERDNDIPLLADHFLRRFRTELHKSVSGFTSDAMQHLLAAPWPGNVRQLENVIERAVLLTESTQIGVEDLPGDLALPGGSVTASPGSMIPENAHLMPLKLALEGPEKLIIERALAHHQGNRQETAATLGINRSTLFNKMRKFDLH